MQENRDLSMTELMQMAQSPAGQQLLHILQQNGGKELQQAMAKAALGDFAQAKKALSSLLNDPQARKLLEELEG